MAKTKTKLVERHKCDGYDDDENQYYWSHVVVDFHALLGAGIEGITDIAESQVLGDNPGVIAVSSYDVVSAKNNVLTVRVEYSIIM